MALNPCSLLTLLCAPLGHYSQANCTSEHFITILRRARLVRLDEIVAGRAKPATPTETIEYAILATQPPDDATVWR